jgi:hypothetical protein
LHQKYARQSQRSAGVARGLSSNSNNGNLRAKSKNAVTVDEVLSKKSSKVENIQQAQPEETTEERLFKFSPLSSKKFEGESGSHNHHNTTV